MKGNKNKKITQLELIKGHRRPMPKPTIVFSTKLNKEKHKKNWIKSLQDELDEDELKLPWEE